MCAPRRGDAARVAIPGLMPGPIKSGSSTDQDQQMLGGPVGQTLVGQGLHEILEDRSSDIEGSATARPEQGGIRPDDRDAVIGEVGQPFLQRVREIVPVILVVDGWAEPARGAHGGEEGRRIAKAGGKPEDAKPVHRRVAGIGVETVRGDDAKAGGLTHGRPALRRRVIRRDLGE